MSNDTVIATLENIRRETTAAIRTIKHFDTVCGHPQPQPERKNCAPSAAKSITTSKPSKPSPPSSDLPKPSLIT
jgi:hypothetical protein